MISVGTMLPLPTLAYIQSESPTDTRTQPWLAGYVGTLLEPCTPYLGLKDR